MIHGQLEHYTQKEVNALFEPSEAYLYVRYCNVIRTFLVAAFFFDLCPLGMPLSFLYLCLQFWTDKYLFLRRSKRMRRFHANLAVELNENTEVAVFLLVAGSIIFKIKSQKSIYIQDLGFLALACLLLFVPLKKLSERGDQKDKVLEDYHAVEEPLKPV